MYRTERKNDGINGGKDMRRTNPARRDSESGIALIISILALLLLTFLGLTLATTSSTELQIATNYRRARQALYNAEAGIEVGRLLLRTQDWGALLMAPRANWPIPTPGVAPSPTWTPPTTTDTDAFSNLIRDHEYSNCDANGNGMGYGQVLNVGGVDYQYISTVPALGGITLNGAFTLWIRRPAYPSTDGANMQDYPSADSLILVSEGVAPAPQSAGMFTSRAFGTWGVQVIEALFFREDLGDRDQRRGGQGGGGRLGAGVSAGGLGGLDTAAPPPGIAIAGP